MPTKFPHSPFPSQKYFPQIYIAYSLDQKSQLMWAVAFGSMLGTFPFSFLYTRFGARFVLFGAGLLSVISTALIPFAAIQLGFPTFLVLRFLQVLPPFPSFLSNSFHFIGNCLFRRFCGNGNDLFSMGLPQAECLFHFRFDLLFASFHGHHKSHFRNCLFYSFFPFNLFCRFVSPISAGHWSIMSIRPPAFSSSSFGSFSTMIIQKGIDLLSKMNWRKFIGAKHVPTLKWIPMCRTV